MLWLARDRRDDEDAETGVYLEQGISLDRKIIEIRPYGARN
jgi:hypothetical protein